MMVRPRIRRLALAALLVVAAPVLAQVGEVQRIRFKQVCQVKPNGDVDMVNRLTFSVQLYTHIKKRVGNTAVLLRELGVTGHYIEVKDAKAEYDDARHAIRVRATLLGAMKNRGKDWFAPIETADKHEVLDADPDAITLLGVNQLDSNVLVVGTTRLNFPKGTRSIRFDPRRGGVLCQMPPPPSQPQGDVNVDMDVRVRPEIMSCFYKIYGNPEFTQLWVAKAVFRNTGTAPLRDFRVRFRIGNYSSWGPWQRSHIVYPTQTVVEPFYPIFYHKVRELKSATPAALEVEWSYRTPDGRLVKESDTRRLVILGLNQVIYSSLTFDQVTTWFEGFNYSPLIAATFVSHTDPVIQRFAGMAAKLAGGVGASINNDNALRFMTAVYDLMVHNQLRYQSPPGLFKRGVRQHVKFGRDVLRNRAGTCIDLAILYASTCRAGGLEPMLVMLPGHCFPVIKLPDGGTQAVEATAISGTPQGQRIPFQVAAQTGAQELAKCMEDGKFYLVDVQKLRKAGVPTPELPDLPPSALNDWGITLPGKKPAPTPPPTPKPQPKPQPPRAQAKEVTDPNNVYALSVPKDWQVQQQQGAIVASDPQQKAKLSCKAEPKKAQSLEQFTKTMINLWKQEFPGWQEQRRSTFELSGHQGICILASSRPNNVPTTALHLAALADRHQLHLVLSCPQPELGRWEPVFAQIAESWQLIAAKTQPPAPTPPQPKPPAPKPPAPKPPAPKPNVKQVRETNGLYTISVPADWQIQQQPGATAGADPTQKANLVVMAVPRQATDLQQFAKVMTTNWRQTVPGWTQVRMQQTQVAGRPALYIHATGKPGGIEVAADYYLVLTQRSQFLLMLSCPRPEHARWQPLFQQIAQSWRVQ